MTYLKTLSQETGRWPSKFQQYGSTAAMALVVMLIGMVLAFVADAYYPTRTIPMYFRLALPCGIGAGILVTAVILLCYKNKIQDRKYHPRIFLI